MIELTGEAEARIGTAPLHSSSRTRIEMKVTMIRNSTSTERERDIEKGRTVSLVQEWTKIEDSFAGGGWAVMS